MKSSVLPRLCILLAAVVLVTGIMLFAVLIRYDLTSGENLELHPVEIVGQYSEEGGPWKPLTREVFFQNLTYRDITVRGHFTRDLPENSKLFMNVDHLRMSLRVNGAEVFSIGPQVGDGNPTKALGKQWVTMHSPGITTEDLVELNFQNLYKNAYIIQFDELLWQMHTGDKQLLVLKSIRIDAWPLGLGTAMLVLTLSLLTTAIGAAVLRIKGARRFLWLGLTTLFAAFWFFPISSAPTLIFPLPVSQISIYAVGMQGMVIFIVLFIAEHLSSWRKKSLLGCTALLLLATEVALINQALGVQDLYMAVDYLSVIDLFTVGWFVYCAVYEARREKNPEASMLLWAMIPFAVMSALEVYNGFFQFGHTAVMLGIGLIIMIVAEGIYALRRIHQSMEREKRALMLENELQQSHIRDMISQIQPHFLFNVLTGIRSLCSSDPEKAEGAMEHFAFFLRSNLDSLSGTQLIPFYKEISHVKDYFYLEKMRFEDRVSLILELEFQDFMLPALTLQPLVENAVRYGIIKRECGGTITITSRQQDGEILLTIRDDGVGFDVDAKKDDECSHTGIENVRNRLKLQCGGSLEIKSEENVGTEVRMILPWKEGVM